MIRADKYAIETLKELMETGCRDRDVRAKYADGVPATTKFITQKVFSYDISEGEFPITTLRNGSIKMGIREILWIYQKTSNSLGQAMDMGVTWWSDWDIGDGTIGERYGKTVANYGIIDGLLSDLEHYKFSRRHIIDLYQYKDLGSSPGLHPCVFLSMFSVREIEGVNYLDLMVVSRSSDFIVAGYINQAQYVALMMMIANHLKYHTGAKWELGKFTFVVNNLHMYERHIPAAKEMLAREPINQQPTMELVCGPKDFYEHTVEDFKFNLPEGIKKLSTKLELAI